MKSKLRSFAVAVRLAAGSAIVTTALSTALHGCQERSELEHLGHVPAFTFTDQSGRPFGSEQLRGKVTVAAFMFTRCPTICPRITATMQQLQSQAKADGVDVHWVSFSVDPENDTPSVLQDYVASRHLDASNWTFLTGDVTQLRTVAEEGYKIAAEGKANSDAEHYGISHGSHLVLVDQAGEIRGYYRTLDDDAQRRLLGDAKRLSSR